VPCNQAGRFGLPEASQRLPRSGAAGNATGFRNCGFGASRQAASLGLPRTEVAQLPATRAANCGIADLPGLSPRTARKHPQGVFAKFGVHSRRAPAQPTGGDVGVT
jgi:hypothetical protein